MRIPFTLEAWLKDKSQKVETAFGEPAKIVFTEGLGKRPILAVIYDGDTTDSAWFTEDGKSSYGMDGLFLVTTEPELTEFEKALDDVIRSYRCDSEEDENGFPLAYLNWVKKKSAELLAIARKELHDEKEG